MLLSTRYWILGSFTTIFLMILVVHRYTLPEEDLSEKKQQLVVIHEEQKIIKNSPTEVLKRDDLSEKRQTLVVQQQEVEEMKKKLFTDIFKKIMNMTFYDDPLNGKCESNTNILRTKDTMECLAKNTIFLLETSGSSRLSARQACAVESASLHHPEWQVRVFFSSHEPLNLTDPYLEILNFFSNVKLLKMNLDFLMIGTPLWYWYKNGSWESSPHKIVHLSDAIRLCLLWKYGGVYLDTDVVVLRSLSNLRNSVSFDSGTNIGNSFLAFDRGQTLLRYALTDFVTSYNPNAFASNGPVLLNRNFREHCKPKSNNVNDNVCEVNVLPKVSVYPIDFNKWEDYFKPQTATLSESAFNSSYIIHVWNKLSSRGKMVVGQNSWYEMAMKIHCPKVYEHVTNIGFA